MQENNVTLPPNRVSSSQLSTIFPKSNGTYPTPSLWAGTHRSTHQTRYNTPPPTLMPWMLCWWFDWTAHLRVSQEHVPWVGVFWKYLHVTIQRSQLFSNKVMGQDCMAIPTDPQHPTGYGYPRFNYLQNQWCTDNAGVLQCRLLRVQLSIPQPLLVIPAMYLIGQPVQWVGTLLKPRNVDRMTQHDLHIWTFLAKTIQTHEKDWICWQIAIWSSFQFNFLHCLVHLLEQWLTAPLQAKQQWHWLTSLSTKAYTTGMAKGKSTTDILTHLPDTQNFTLHPQWQ